MFIGQTTLVRQLTSLLPTDRLATGYIVVAPDGMGKRTLALELGAEYLGTVVAELHRHPDFIYLTPEEKGGSIKLETVRELKWRLGNRSFTGKAWVVVDGADQFTIEAQNAWLKILEEPPKGLISWWLVENEELILPTIRSRMVTLRFSLVDEGEMIDGLTVNGLSADQINLALPLALGSPGRALTLAGSNEELVQAQSKQAQAKRFLDGTKVEKFGMIGEITADKKSGEMVMLGLVRELMQMVQGRISSANRRIHAQLEDSTRSINNQNATADRDLMSADLVWEKVGSWLQALLNFERTWERNGHLGVAADELAGLERFPIVEIAHHSQLLMTD